MLFFKSLSLIGVTREYLQDLSGEDTIRIEKKLIAEMRLNASLSKNDIEQIMYVLKEYPAEIKSVCYYEGLYTILSGKKAEYTDSPHFHNEEEKRRIKELISIYLKEEIILFITQNIQQNNWNNLRILAGFTSFLGSELEQFLIVRLEGKIKEATAVAKKATFSFKKTYGYLKKKDFFLLLNEIDIAHFKPILYELLDLIERHRQYVDHNIFFYELLKAIAFYDPNDEIFAFRIRLIYEKVGIPPHKIILGIVLVLAVPVSFYLLIALTVAMSHNQSKVRPITRINSKIELKDEVDPEKRLPYFLEEQNILMLNFVEARMFPIANPMNAKAQKAEYVTKYDNPFSEKLFRIDFNSIRNPGKQINIFNNTDNECVLLAYYYAIEQKEDYFSRSGEPKIPRIYALYIPKKDSIKIDFDMYLLRFYMGGKLKHFNTYKGYVYADSTDLKFSEFSKRDSVLFRHAFTFPETEAKKSKQQNLIISSPNQHHYKLEWTGKSAVYCFINLIDYFNLKDSVTRLHPLLLSDKPETINKDDGIKEQVSSFLETRN